MVRVLWFFLLLCSFVYAQNPLKERLDEKIQTIIPQEVFWQNQKFIDVVFSPAKRYFTQDRVDSIKVVQTLKENGLLKLFFEKPTAIELRFKTNSSAMFFVKVMEDTLRSIGYYRFVTKNSSYNNSEFIWSVGLTSEYVIDPMILQKELQKRGAYIVDIKRETPTLWEYTINMDSAHLDAISLKNFSSLHLQRSLTPYWIDSSDIQALTIKSGGRNRWYPHIAFYDRLLHLIAVQEEDKRTRSISFKIPKGTKYIKISDIYTMKNLKSGLDLEVSK